MNELAVFTGTVSPETTQPYINHPFEVPTGTRRVRVRLSYLKPGICQLYLSVFAPNGYQGSRMLPAAIGEVLLELDFMAEGASLGGIRGEIVPGEWRAQLDLERTVFTVDYRLTIETDDHPVFATHPNFLESNLLETLNGRSGAGWYRGELHSHTLHSDGRNSVEELVAAARHFKLDFLALTDHFTTAGWAELEGLSGGDLCVMRGLEITGHRGHANLHGMTEWINPFVDEPENWSINDAARAIHAQGGLFCVNHPFALDLGWRYHEFDWALCDLMEIYHHHEGGMNTAQLALWDGLLRAGHRITGVAGTDSHDAFRGRHRLGQVVTVVRADALEPGAILGGLRAGAAYVTFGPTLNFSARSAGSSAEMGETLLASGAVELHIELSDLEYPARMVVLKNGWYHKHFDVSAGDAALALRDLEPIPGYYRLEVYARPAQAGIGSGRDWAETLVLSNPIYIEAARGENT